MFCHSEQWGGRWETQGEDKQAHAASPRSGGGKPSPSHAPSSRFLGNGATLPVEIITRPGGL